MSCMLFDYAIHDVMTYQKLVVILRYSKGVEIMIIIPYKTHKESHMTLCSNNNNYTTKHGIIIKSLEAKSKLGTITLNKKRTRTSWFNIVLLVCTNVCYFLSR